MTTDEIRAERRQLRNMISGVNTQSKRPSGARRRLELEARLAALTLQLEDIPARLRIADIDGRWNMTVGEVTAATYGRPGDYRSETRHRNQLAGKRARRGLKRLETVAEEIRRLGEAKALHLVATRPELAAIAAELAEADQLRAELLHRAEARMGIAA